MYVVNISSGALTSVSDSIFSFSWKFQGLIICESVNLFFFFFFKYLDLPNQATLEYDKKKIITCNIFL